MNETGYHLHRDAERRWVAGVCAGVADYLDIAPALVRLAAVFGLIFFPLPTVIAYVAMALGLPLDSPLHYASREEERFHRGLATAPADTLSDLDRSFAAIERRIARMEALVTSTDFDLHRGFRDLGR